MYYNYYQTLQYEYDECIAKGICSINPTLSSLQEVILLYLKELAFYLLKLKALGVTNNKIKDDVLDALSDLVANIDYNQETYQDIVSRLYEDLAQAKQIYENMCQKNQIEHSVLKTHIKHSKNFSLTEAIRKGEKYHLKKTTLFKPLQMNLFDIMLFLVKSVCINMIDLKSYGIESEEAYHGILTMLNAMNFHNTTDDEVKAEIQRFISIYFEIVKTLHKTKIANFGNITPSEVSLSTHSGKAILVSGSDLKELELVLKATKNRGVDVYTHGMDMIMGHSLPKLKAYPNLIGHFGKGLDNCLIDFAVFPGAILMTKHSLYKVEYLYRGRLFTTDPVAPRGVVKIKNNDFEPLIQSALDSKGFHKGQQRSPMLVGYNEQDVIEKTNKIIDKVLSGEIKHIFIVGLLNYSSNHKQYFEKLLNLMPKDSYAFSLAFDKKAENIFHIDSFYDFSLVYKVLLEFQKRIPLENVNISAFITYCDKHTISNILNLKNLGIKNIYMGKCSPTLVNPALIGALRNIFDIKEFTKAEDDLKYILENS